MSDKQDIFKAQRDPGHRIILGPTREGCTRAHQDLTQGKGNYLWIDDCGGSGGKTKQAVTLIDSFIKLGDFS